MKEINFLNDVLPLKDRLFRLAWRITLDKAEAEDIVQDTLLRMWNQREEWSAITNPEAYSITICRNLALDRSRRASASYLTLSEQRDESPDTQPAPDEQLHQAERVKMVRQAMDTLPEVQRTLMTLRDIEGKTYQEIGEILSLSEAQVKVYLHRARTKIKNRIEQIERYGL